jgi:accessory gene regulator B
MIQSLALRIALRIKTVVPDHPASTAVLSFSIAALLNVSGVVVITMLVSVLTGREWEALTAIISFAVLRQLSGGYHLPSTDLCVLISVLGLTGISYISFSSDVTWIVTLLAAALVLVFAPTDIKNQSRISEKYYPLLKYLSLLIVLSNLAISSSVVAVAFLIQSISLIHGRR